MEMKNCINTAFAAAAAVCILCTVGWAYDPPELIAVLRPDSANPRNFGRDFTCIGDQNGDGYDDLVLFHGPWDNDPELWNDFPTVKLFHGGRAMDSEPDFIWRSDCDRRLIGLPILFTRNLTADQKSFLLIGSMLYDNGPGIADHNGIEFYSVSEHLNNVAEFMIFGNNSFGFKLGGYYIGHLNISADFNSDGFNDVFLVSGDEEVPILNILYGSEEFDTIPDWRMSLTNADTVLNSFVSSVSTGYDINGDDFDDLLIKSLIDLRHERRDFESGYYYYLFLGGDPMDTIPALVWRQDAFVNDLDRQMRYGFRLLPDLNDDGYDDWGISFLDDYDFRFAVGWLIFYGGAEPDDQPDVEIIQNLIAMGENTEICGGDFNADGCNDIVWGWPGAFRQEGALIFHFGRGRGGIDSEPDLVVNTTRTYGDDFVGTGWRVGAVGDYNGDGIEDFVSGNASEGLLAVFAGSRSWRVDAPEDTPIIENFRLNANPNPFNSALTITCRLPSSSPIELSIHDIQGRLVEDMNDGTQASGEHSLVWQAANQPAGVYFVRLQASQANHITVSTQKVVLIK